MKIIVIISSLIFINVELKSSEVKLQKNKVKIEQPCKIKLPRIRNGCQGEICECRTGYSLHKSSNLYVMPSKNSKIISKLPSRTRFRGRKLQVLTKKYGIDYLVESKRYIHQISYIGEGVIELCEGEKIFTKQFNTYNKTSIEIRPIKGTVTEEWAQVTLADNSKGWVLKSNLTSSEGDGCDFDPPLN